MAATGRSRGRRARSPLTRSRDQAMSVTEGALRVGYSNLGHFTRIFTRLTGILPSEYRRAAQTALSENERMSRKTSDSR
ncbi:helix-turn-helix domain-containing protein [Sphingosinicella sp. CPCC 101087]|uniref:helix-turn-helix domain-containing protein n=1 Tax=Sphingosinicella sp. CPCC 101087 TaxID=2497754 RepID=UPI00101B7E8D|nr:helix-turn-helix domain-containing protein [Sphingosinicella sp. CPCC 101087]